MSRSGRTPQRSRRGGGTVRIIGGQWKRRVLPVADVDGLRPTPDRVRETLFNWLTHAFGDLAGLAVLDLFAGSGALGFEAASRGAAAVILVERSAVAADRLRAARALLGATQIDIREGDALRIGQDLADTAQSFDLVLLDPPFAQRWIDTALPLAARLCRPGGFVYAEAEMAVTEAALSGLGLEIYRTDKAGEVFYHLLRRNK